MPGIFVIFTFIFGGGLLNTDIQFIIILMF